MAQITIIENLNELTESRKSCGHQLATIMITNKGYDYHHCPTCGLEFKAEVTDTILSIIAIHNENMEKFEKSLVKIADFQKFGVKWRLYRTADEHETWEYWCERLDRRGCYYEASQVARSMVEQHSINEWNLPKALLEVI